MTGHRFSETDFLANDLIWLMQCDEVLFLGPSRGASLEKAFAERLGKPVKTYREFVNLCSKGGVK